MKPANRAKTQFTRVFAFFLPTELFDAYEKKNTPCSANQLNRGIFVNFFSVISRGSFFFKMEHMFCII
jgi:hypothetical protein